MPVNMQGNTPGNIPGVTAKKILIVEDNELNRKLFCDLLSSQGYTVYHTDDGHKAYGYVRQVRPDLVLMDIQLPEVSGLDITRAIKADPEVAHIPVIAVTAFAMKGDEEKIMAGGCQAYIAKPITVHHFLAVVQQYLGCGPAALPVETRTSSFQRQ
jgi:two-component system, cell cycle response regulator DivK